jgi:Tol biopolymer transport system component
VTDRSGDDEIYRINDDGSGALNLTNAPANAYRQLCLSPDETRLIFDTDRVGCYNLWIMDLDGSNPTQLTGIQLG